jgi:hypothetical protein
MVAHPDIMRFGLAPLMLGQADMCRAGVIPRGIVASGSYRQPQFAVQ